MKWFKTMIHIAAFPLIVLALLIGFMLVYRLLGLPSSEELINIARSYMVRYGYAVVFVGAFLEATPVVNLYMPGSTIVILAVAFSRQGTMNVFVVLAVATVAFLLAYVLNYVAGRYGWHTLLYRCGLGNALDRMQSRISAHGAIWVFPAYVHPNIGAVASTACGVLDIRFNVFVIYSAAALIGWNAIWGAATYFGSSVILRFADTRWLITLVIAWLLLAVVKGILKHREE